MTSQHPSLLSMRGCSAKQFSFADRRDSSTATCSYVLERGISYSSNLGDRRPITTDGALLDLDSPAPDRASPVPPPLSAPDSGLCRGASFHSTRSRPPSTAQTHFTATFGITGAAAMPIATASANVYWRQPSGGRAAETHDRGCGGGAGFLPSRLHVHNYPCQQRDIVDGCATSEGAPAAHHSMYGMSGAPANSGTPDGGGLNTLVLRRSSRSCTSTAAGGGDGRTVQRVDVPHQLQNYQHHSSSNAIRRRRSCTMGLPPELIAISDYLGSVQQAAYPSSSTCSGTPVGGASHNSRRPSHMAVRDRERSSASNITGARSGALSPATGPRTGNCRKPFLVSGDSGSSFSFAASWPSPLPTGGAGPAGRKVGPVSRSSAPAHMQPCGLATPDGFPIALLRAAGALMPTSSTAQRSISRINSRKSTGPPRSSWPRQPPPGLSRSKSTRLSAVAAACVRWLKGTRTGTVTIGGRLESGARHPLNRSYTAPVGSAGNGGAHSGDMGQAGADVTEVCSEEGCKQDSGSNSVATGVGISGAGDVTGAAHSRPQATGGQLPRKWAAFKAAVKAGFAPFKTCAAGGGQPRQQRCLNR